MRFLLIVFRFLGHLVRSIFRPVARPQPVTPPQDLRTESEFWDAARGRRIPYRVYEPETRTFPAPVVIFSHGLGGTVDAAPYLGRALAAAGYWGIFIQHPGTDRSALQGSDSRDELRRRLKSASRDGARMRERFFDLPFVLDELTRLNETPGHMFKGKLDLDRVGCAGHSYGSRTVLAACGQRVGPFQSFRDDRVRAGVLLSPSSTVRPGAAEDPKAAASAFENINVPLFHVTGTNDAQDPFSSGPVNIEHRTRPYQLIRAKNQYLLVLDGAGHGDLVAGSDTSGHSDRYRWLIAVAAVLFFDAYLRGSEASRSALRRDFRANLKPGDKFEFK